MPTRANRRHRKQRIDPSLSSEDRRAIALEVCQRVANGEYLSAVCKSSPRFPTAQCFWCWRNDDPIIFAAYADAQEARAERLADEIVEVADEKPNHFVDEKGRERIDPGSVAHQKLRVDTRRWVAAKLLPKRYGEYLDIGGKLGIEIIPPEIVLDKVRKMSPLLARLAGDKN
jgi:hypothetical protein